MDTMSIATAHPALADGAARLPGSRHLPSGSPTGAGAMGIAPSRSASANQPNSLDTAALPYEGGAVATLDFTPEVERRKAVRSISPTTS
jgi:hypothetical protein